MTAQQAGVAEALNAEVTTLYREGKYLEATPLAERNLVNSEQALGPDHPDVGRSLNNLASLYRARGRYAEAEPLYRRALAINLKALGADHPDVAISLQNMAALYRAQGRYAEAEPLYRRGLAIRQKALGPDHPDVGRSLNNLAGLYRDQGRYAEAEPLYRRALALAERALGSDDPDVGRSLNNLAELYRTQGRYAEAEPLYQRCLAIYEKALGRDHPDVGAPLNNLAGLYDVQGRYVEAEPLHKRSLAIAEKALGPNHPDVALSLNNLAELYRDQKRYTDAVPLAKRALSIREKALGPDHLRVGESLNNLALLYSAQERVAEAEPLFKRALKLAEKGLGVDHPHVGATLANLAELYSQQRDWMHAAHFWQRSTGLLTRRAERGTETIGRAQTGKAKSEYEQNAHWFYRAVKVGYRLAASERVPEHRDEMFQMAQWALGSEAAASLAQMAARGGTDNPALASTIRERQDLVAEWQKGDATRNVAASQSNDKRDKPAEAANIARLDAIDRRIAQIDQVLAKDFPQYAALASPKPVSIADVQSQLHDDEALVLFLTTPKWEATPEESFIWAVTKTNSKWVKSDIGTDAMRASVGSLRCGLDESAWFGEGRAYCAGLHGIDPAIGWQRGEPLPFSPGKAYELYASLFNGIEDLIQDKHLLLVPSGPLASLPFQVLLTEAPANAPYAKAFWLIRKHALTVLPSVASLAALRRNAHLSAAPEPFIGYGNPVLTGESGCGEIVIPASCPGQEVQVAAAPITVARSAKAIDDLPNFFRNGLANVAAVRKLCPLPDTAHELTCVANSLGAPQNSIVLGKYMTEAAVKKAPLDRYRVVHFATHGLLAGETAQMAITRAEPALVMSPPAIPTEEDDGLLTASEVAALKLNADWVVMSACNTAGSGEPGAEALSGLARAFFYAGARALLVSHWPVNSYAATMLTSRTFAEMRKEKDIGRSEAFRRAMLALMGDAPWAAHPAVWAPFIVVGEGGAPGKVATATAVQSPVADTFAVSTPLVVVEPAKPAAARKKVKRKPKSDDDWITNIFGQ